MIEGVQPLADPVVDAHVEPAPKPCCARMRSPDGRQWWCRLPADHEGDHEGASRGELGLPAGFSDTPPRRYAGPAKEKR